MNLKGKTLEELVALGQKIREEREGWSAPGNSIWKFKPHVRKKLDAIDRAITDRLAEKRAAAGRPVPTCGYSGRQTNKRR